MAKWGQAVPAALAEVCDRCAVKVECLEMALADPSLVGVWGSTTDRQRAQLRRRGEAA